MCKRVCVRLRVRVGVFVRVSTKEAHSWNNPFSQHALRRNRRPRSGRKPPEIWWGKFDTLSVDELSAELSAIRSDLVSNDPYAGRRCDATSASPATLTPDGRAARVAQLKATPPGNERRRAAPGHAETGPTLQHREGTIHTVDFLQQTG